MRERQVAEVITELEALCFPDDNWNMGAVTSALERPDILYGIEYGKDNRPVGYYIAAASFDEAELYRIGVLYEQRGKGMGKLLINKFIGSCPKETKRIFLEVRESNSAAVALYKSTGFKEIGRRKNYYRDEDGIVMELTLND